jgi:Mannosyl-glycoprotein endo-beta-N-acetylglucosaminidase
VFTDRRKMTTPAPVPEDVARFLANEAILTYCAQASKARSVWPSVILAQWGIETAWGTSSAFVDGHNFAGISSGGQVLSYPNYPAGLEAYVWVLGLDYYAAVREAHESGPIDQAYALGASPWAAGHYRAAGSTVDGSLLVQVIEAYGLERFDALDGGGPGTPPPPPPPFAKLDNATASRIVHAAYVLVLNRTPTGAEFSTWVDSLEAGVREPAQLVEELTLEPQSFLSPLVRRDAPKA